MTSGTMSDIEAPKASDPGSVDPDIQAARRLLPVSAIRTLAADQWGRWNTPLDLSLLAVFVILLTVFLAPFPVTVKPIPPLESVATDTVRSKRDILVEDKVATEFRRREAGENALPVFDFDADLYTGIGAPIRTALQNMTMRLTDASLTFNDRFAAFQRDFALPINPTTYEIIERLEDPNDVNRSVDALFASVLNRYVVDEPSALPASGGIILRDVATGETRLLDNVSGVITRENVEEIMRDRAADIEYQSARVIRSWILSTALRLVRSNVTLNDAATQRARTAAIESAEPVYVRFGAGEVIVRNGERITPAIQERLHLLYQTAKTDSIWPEILALLVLIAALLAAGAAFLHQTSRPRRLDRKQVYISLSVAGGTLLICLIVQSIGLSLADILSLSASVVPYLLPISLASLVISALVNLRVGVMVAATLTLLIAYLADASVWFVVYHMAGILAAGLLARRCRKRSDVVKVGLMAGVVQMVMAPIVATLAIPMDAGVASLLTLALGSGLLTGLLASAALPLLERFFEEMTDMRLLELASADNPVLKDLALHAPGTYYHSVLIANLSESAGEAIGANPLRCRVKALYHRIGEAARPNAFNENQRSRNVLHRLPPNLAVRVVVAPIRDGIEIARRNRFGQVIVNAVSQQHGTMLIKPIYLRAVEEARASGTTVNEDDYRYPGPKPQTKPAGILMLATLVEATIRALKDPSDENIRARVDKAIEEAMSDGQLDEAPLTVQDLRLIAEAFRRVLALGAGRLRPDERSEMSLRDAAMRLEAANRHDENGNSTVHPLPTVARRTS
jgi:cyclic-di-AMP phosphodiesterase PgpH